MNEPKASAVEIPDSKRHSKWVVSSPKDMRVVIDDLESQIATLEANAARDQQVIAEKDAQIARLTARVERIRNPKVFEGPYYSAIELPEVCPECEAKAWISHGTKGMCCYVCFLLKDLDAAEAQLAERDRTWEGVRREALEEAAEICQEWVDAYDPSVFIPYDDGYVYKPEESRAAGVFAHGRFKRAVERIRSLASQPKDEQKGQSGTVSHGRCKHCGAEEERHYDGVQCPLGNDTYSATLVFEPSQPKEPGQ